MDFYQSHNNSSQCNRSTRNRKIVNYPGYASHIAKTNVVTWIGLRKLKKIGLVRLSETKFCKVSLRPTNHGIMQAILKEPTKNHIITIDGMCSPNANPEHPRLLIVCRDICENENTCKLVIASSMKAIGKEFPTIKPTTLCMRYLPGCWMITIGLLRIIFFKAMAKKTRCFVRYGVALQDIFRC